MATTLSTLRTRVRQQLTEASALFWTDAELLEHLTDGAKDLWRRINDLYEHHFLTLDESNMSISANSSSVTGVPADVYRIVSIEPRILGESSPNPGLIFSPKNWNEPVFRVARAENASEPKHREIFYTLFNAGAPVGAPTIRIAPQLSSAVNLTVAYNHTLPTLVAGDNNPIPGESDNALIAWALAYARSKERDDRSPDPEWLAVYGTEKTNLIAQMAVRQIQEPEYVNGLFDDYDSGDW
jgi:hypothetical protein